MRPGQAVIGVLFLLAAAAGAAAWFGAGWRPPERCNPLAPLRLEEPPGVLTRFKLARLGDDPAACLATLATSRLRFEPVPDRESAPGCAIRNAVRVERVGPAQSSPPFVLSCPAALSLALWERHVLQPGAQRHFAEPVVRLEHWGSYACRNVYGRERGRRSQHATADALDVAGVVLQGGRRVRVARDWDGDERAAQFLRALRDGACGFYDGVLGPDYNEAHADHLHLDRGPDRVCR
jgi:hypothetical protein